MEMNAALRKKRKRKPNPKREIRRAMAQVLRISDPISPEPLPITNEELGFNEWAPDPGDGDPNEEEEQFPGGYPGYMVEPERGRDQFGPGGSQQHVRPEMAQVEFPFNEGGRFRPSGGRGDGRTSPWDENETGFAERNANFDNGPPNMDRGRMMNSGPNMDRGQMMDREFMMGGGPPMNHGQFMGRGGPPMMQDGPPMNRGGPPMMQGGPPMGQGGPPMMQGGPQMGHGGPPMMQGGPPPHFMNHGGPPMDHGGPPMNRGGPPMQYGGPPMDHGGPPMNRGGPPMDRGGPPINRGGAPMNRGGPPIDGDTLQPSTRELLAALDKLKKLQPLNLPPARPRDQSPYDPSQPSEDPSSPKKRDHGARHTLNDPRGSGSRRREAEDVVSDWDDDDDVDKDKLFLSMLARSLKNIRDKDKKSKVKAIMLNVVAVAGGNVD